MDKYYPRQPYVDLKQDAIKAAYGNLPAAERAVIDSLVDRVMVLRSVKNMGRVFYS